MKIIKAIVFATALTLFSAAAASTLLRVDTGTILGFALAFLMIEDRL